MPVAEYTQKRLQLVVLVRLVLVIGHTAGVAVAAGAAVQLGRDRRDDLGQLLLLLLELLRRGRRRVRVEP
jgi:hypothetical protein